MLFEGIIERFSVLKSHSKAPGTARLTAWQSIAIAQVEAERTERCRAGRMFRALGVAAGAAPVQAIPTTTATHFLWNSDPYRSIIVESIDTYLLSGTATIGAAILGIVSPITATLPAAATGSLVGSCSGGGLQSKAIFATAYTIPTPANGYQWGTIPMTSQPGGVPGVGGCFSCDVRGGIIIPPQRGLGLAVMAGTGTSPLYVPTITYTEAELDLE